MSENFADILVALTRDDLPLTSDMLSEISDMSRAKRTAFAAAWPDISLQRRREIITVVVEMAENDIGFDFNAILRQALDDEDPQIRARAVYGLWEDEDPDLIGPLLNLLHNDKDDRVREQVVESLGRFILLGELGDLDSPRSFAVQEALLAVYQNSQETINVRCRALESLAYSDDDAVKDLIESAYYSKDERLTYSALRSMGRNADTEWQDIVTRELENAKPDFRLEAAQACGRLELVEAVHALGEMAETDPDPEVRAMAIWALGQIGDIEARRIINTLWDRQEEEGEEEDDFIRNALLDAQEELSFQDDVLDMSHFGRDWDDDDWPAIEDVEDFEEDDGSNGHGY